jgi:hypothetical protein
MTCRWETQKIETFGERFLQAIASHCGREGLPLDAGAPLQPASRSAHRPPPPGDRARNDPGEFS